MYFCGDTSFFSLNWALHTISAQKLTGTLRAFWNRESVELLTRGGEIVLATTRDPELYCPEAPITLVNIDEESTARARQHQRETGRPLFITLAHEGLVIREPSVQLVQHYGQKLFAQLWTASRVRFIFEQSEQLPEYAQEVPGEEDVDHWALSTLRFIQFGELGKHAEYDSEFDPGLHAGWIRARAATSSDRGGSAVRLAIQRRPLDRPDREESAARFEVCASHFVPFPRARNHRMLAADGRERETGKAWRLRADVRRVASASRTEMPSKTQSPASEEPSNIVALPDAGEVQAHRFSAPENFINRELSWLEFNRRVLEEAQDPTQPLIERVKFLTHRQLESRRVFRDSRRGDQAADRERNERCRSRWIERRRKHSTPFSATVHEMVATQYALWRDELLPALAKNGIRVHNVAQLNANAPPGRADISRRKSSRC